MLEILMPELPGFESKYPGYRHILRYYKSMLSLKGWTLATSCLLVVAANAQVQRVQGRSVVKKSFRSRVSVNPATIQTIKPDVVAKIDSRGALNGPFVQMPTIVRQKNVINWQMAFDSMNTNPTSMVAYSNFYGSGVAPYTFSDPSKIFSAANDMTLTAGTTGKLAQRIRLGLNWNPNGTNPRSGTADLMVRIWCVNNIGTDLGPVYSDRLGGIEVIKRSLAGSTSSYIMDIDLTALSGLTTVGTPRGLPLPANNLGGIYYEIGTTDGGTNFVPLSGLMEATPLYGAMYSPGESYFAGTNPSKSGPGDWEDYTSLAGGSASRTPDYMMQDYTNTAGAGDWSEYYYNDGGPTFGIGQPATALFINPQARLITGTLTLSGRVPGAALPTMMSYKLYSGTSLIDSGTAGLSDSLGYTIPDPNVNGGTYTLVVRNLSYLGKKATVTTTASPTTVANFTLNKLGDINHDDTINLLDFSLLSANYGKDSSSPTWNVVSNGGSPSDCDLNGDEVINLNDFSILSSNYGLSSETP